MKRHDRLTEILAWTLKGQTDSIVDDKRAPQLAAKRMQEALAGERPFDETEREILLRSAAARGKLRFLAEARRAEQLLRWRGLAIEDALELQAAAGGPLEPISVANNDFSLTALPLDDDGRAWLLHLRLSPRLIAELKGKPLAVRDEQGDVWLEGSPDEDGEVSAPWIFDGTPADRLVSQRLFIEPL